MKFLITLLLVCGAVYAQDNTKGQTVTLTSGPPAQGITALNYYDGSNNLIYRCQAVSRQATYTWSVAATTLTSIVDSSNTSTVTTAAAHGLQVGNQVTVAGASASALNRSYAIATVPNTTTFTITTSGVADATYTTGVSVTTTAPRSTVAIWSIRAYLYSGANITAEQWANGSTAMNQICDNRASISYQ